MSAQNRIEQHQRSHGRAHVAFDGPAAGLSTLRQQGSAKAIPLPGPEVVFLNTSGGLTGGDTLSYSIDVPCDARVTATTQTAERLYRASDGRARIEMRAQVGHSGHLDWLPQETILFNKCNASRRSLINLGPHATCLMAETLVLGRAAMGETVTDLIFDDWRQITRQGQPLHLEPLRIREAGLGSGPAGLDGARALASVVMVAQDAQDALGPLRALLPMPDVQAAASAFDGRLVVRLLGHDGWPVRRALATILTHLRRRPLPRVWQI